MFMESIMLVRVLFFRVWLAVILANRMYVVNASMVFKHDMYLK